MVIKKMIFVLAALVATNAFAATTWNLSNPYAPTNITTRMDEAFSARVEEATNGELKIKVHPLGTLIKNTEIKNAVRSGQIQMGSFLTSLLSNEAPIITADGIPFITTSYEDAKLLYQASKRAIDDYFKSQGMRVLYAPLWQTQGLYTDRPIESLSDLKGLKFRAYNKATAQFAELVGAIPTQIEFADLAQAFSTGRVNTMITASGTGVDLKAWDYIKYFYNLQAMWPLSVVVVNEKAFQTLDDKTQELLLQIGEELQAAEWEEARTDNERSLEIFREHGMIVSDGNPKMMDEAKKISDVMIKEWEDAAGAPGKNLISNYRMLQKENPSSSD